MERDNSPKVSVISPVYGVEKFIARVVRSMLSQSLQDVEFIFVDDCTPDRSIDILQAIVDEFPHRASSVTILRHETNKGLPAARNSGLAVARGEYIFHWDSDDFAELDMLECMYDAARTNNADYVWSDWFLSFENGERIMHQPDASTPRETLTLALSGEMRYNVWNKLVARSLYESSDIRFPEGLSMGEDMTMIKLLTKARRTAHVAKPLYHYIRTNSGAMTQIYSERHLRELRQNTADICSFLLENISDRAIVEETDWFKLNVKLPFLFTGRRHDIRMWRQWYAEADRHIMSNSHQALRTRLVQKLAAMHLDAAVMIYNRMVGLFYRVAANR